MFLTSVLVEGQTTILDGIDELGASSSGLEDQIAIFNSFQVLVAKLCK